MVGSSKRLKIKAESPSARSCASLYFHFRFCPWPGCGLKQVLNAELPLPVNRYLVAKVGSGAQQLLLLSLLAWQKVYFK